MKLLVEEGGRVNYDVKLGQPKGLIGVPRVGGVAVAGPWQVRTIDVPALAQAVLDAAAVTGATGGVAGPAGLRATFTLDAESDLFLDTAGWGKGYAWVNGFFLGRYWSRGPQRTLYVPKPATRAGENTVIVVELAAMTDATARFVARPDLGHEGRSKGFGSVRPGHRGGDVRAGGLLPGIRSSGSPLSSGFGQAPVLSRTMSRVATRSVFGEPPSIAPMSASTARSPSSSNS